MREKVVEYKDDRWEVRLVLREANVLAGLRRGVLQNQARRVQEQDALRAWVRAEIYPDLFCAVVEGSFKLEGEELWPLSFEDYIALPELPVALSDSWYSAVYETNPSWSSAQQEDEPDPKGEATTKPATGSTPN